MNILVGPRRSAGDRGPHHGRHSKVTQRRINNQGELVSMHLSMG